jgi:hypothetical protein
MFNFFFRKSYLWWDNVEKYCRAGQATGSNMSVIQRTNSACWSPKSTNMYSEYVTLLFHCNSGYTKAPHCYVVVHCLSCFICLQHFPFTCALYIARRMRLRVLRLYFAYCVCQIERLFIFQLGPVLWIIKYVFIVSLIVFRCKMLTRAFYRRKKQNVCNPKPGDTHLFCRPALGNQTVCYELLPKERCRTVSEVTQTPFGGGGGGGGANHVFCPLAAPGSRMLDSWERPLGVVRLLWWRPDTLSRDSYRVCVCVCVCPRVFWWSGETMYIWKYKDHVTG